MADDSFFREVNEDLRSERLHTFWARYGWIIITAVVLIIAATAGYRGYEYWQAQRAAQSGDAFLEAMNLAGSGDTEAALAAFDTLSEEGHGSYPVLARMRGATLRAETGAVDEAIAEFRAIGEDGDAPIAIREAARLRAAYLLVDHGTYDDVAAVVTTMTGDDHPMRHSAREALGLAAWKADDLETAREWMDQIVADEAAPASLAQRAAVVLDLIAAAGPEGAEAPADAPAEPQPAGEAAPAAPAAAEPFSLDDIAPELAPTMPEAEEAEPAAQAPAVETPAGDAAPEAEGTGEPAAPQQDDAPAAPQ